MQGSLAEEPHRRGLVGGSGESAGSVVEAVLGLCDPAEHRLGMHHPPRVADRREDPDSLGRVTGRSRRVTEHQ